MGDRGDFGMTGIGQRSDLVIGKMFMEDQKIVVGVRCTIDPDGISINYGDEGRDVPAVTDDARYILSILPEIIALFLEKNMKYASVEDGYDLGEAGIIPDVNRKLGILVDRIWHERPTVGEDTDEVIGDVIGHLLLMLAKRRGNG